MIKKKDLLEAISILESNQSKLEDAIKALDQKIVDISNSLLEVCGTSDSNTQSIRALDQTSASNRSSVESLRRAMDGVQNSMQQIAWTKEKDTKDFISFLKEKYQTDYNDYCMANETKYITRVNDIPIVLPNATVRKEYSASFSLPDDLVESYEVEGLDKEKDGLEAVVDKLTCTISGTPVNANDYTLVIKYKYVGWDSSKPSALERMVHLIVNPNPKDLWQDIPTEESIPYFQPDKECDYVKVLEKDGEARKDITVASVRGRSHAHKGSPRDDHYRVEFNEGNEWYVLAVADGAGSAKYSRRGSTIACDTVVNFCNEGLKDCASFEDLIKSYADNKTIDSKKAVLNELYKLLANAAYKATQAIEKEAADVNAAIDRFNTEGESEDFPAPEIKEKVTERDYATTLLLSISKKFDFGWFIASFWVGDGAICIYKRGTEDIPSMAKMMGVPDSGEQAGQTVFITMKNMVFKDPSALYNRLKFEIVDDFDALFLMSDGVSDPMFETDANLANPQKWDEFWENLAGKNDDGVAVHLTDDNEESKNELLKWLDFYIGGNHDDRTIAILY